VVAWAGSRGHEQCIWKRGRIGGSGVGRRWEAWSPVAVGVVEVQIGLKSWFNLCNADCVGV